MIWFSFANWSLKADSLFIYERVYQHGWRWTPIVMIRSRYSV